MADDDEWLPTEEEVLHAEQEEADAPYAPWNEYSAAQEARQLQQEAEADDDELLLAPKDTKKRKMHTQCTHLLLCRCYIL